MRKKKLRNKRVPKTSSVDMIIILLAVQLLSISEALSDGNVGSPFDIATMSPFSPVVHTVLVNSSQQALSGVAECEYGVVNSNASH